MKVYVALIHIDYEPGNIIGVFSCPEAAEHYLVEYALKYYADDVEVWETDIDKAVYA